MKATNGAGLGTAIAAMLLLGACEAMLSNGAADVAAGQQALQVAHATGSGSGHGRLLPPTRVTAAGRFNGVAYVQYDGAFEGSSALGFYRVPYRIITIADPDDDGNRIVWVEPSHSVAPTITLDYGLGRQFLFGRGFSYAVVGWNTEAGSMLDRSPGFVIWIAGEQVDDDGDGAMDEDQVDGVDNDGDGAVDEDSLTAPGLLDDDIIAHFGAALRNDAVASGMLGKVRRSYLAGASQTSPPVRRLIQSGAAEGVFAAAFPWINFDVVTGGLQSALTHGTYSGKVIVVNAEADELIHDGALLEDDGSTPNNYRFFIVPGAPHVADAFVGFVPRTSPASFVPQVRAHAWQLHRWAQSGKAPPASTHPHRDHTGAIVRDAMGNMVSVDITGRRAPRLPHVELGEARFVAGFVGGYADVRSIDNPGFFADWESYAKAFAAAARDYKRAGFMLGADKERMMARARLSPGATFTENYRDRYDAFVAVESSVGDDDDDEDEDEDD